MHGRGFVEGGGLWLLLMVEGEVVKGVREVGVGKVWRDGGCWVGGMGGEGRTQHSSFLHVASIQRLPEHTLGLAH